MADAPATTLMTADDLLRLPDDGNQYELVRGKLICMGGSSARPAIVAMRMGIRIGTFIEQNRLVSTVKRTSDSSSRRAPTRCACLTSHSCGRSASQPTASHDSFWRGAPDLALEVFSPTNRFTDVLQKVYEFLDAGARLVWVVEPEARKATVFPPGRNAPVTVGEDGALDGEDVLPGFTLALRDVWV